MLVYRCRRWQIFMKVIWTVVTATFKNQFCKQFLITGCFRVLRIFILKVSSISKQKIYFNLYTLLPFVYAFGNGTEYLSYSYGELGLSCLERAKSGNLWRLINRNGRRKTWSFCWWHKYLIIPRCDTVEGELGVWERDVYTHTILEGLPTWPMLWGFVFRYSGVQFFGCLRTDFIIQSTITCRNRDMFYFQFPFITVQCYFTTTPSIYTKAASLCCKINLIITLMLKREETWTLLINHLPI